MRRLLLLISVFAVQACVAPTDEKPMDGPAVGLNVVGSVRTAEGTAIVGATLEVWARDPETCAGGFAQQTVTSDSAGTFASALFAWNSPRDVCVWIAIEPPVGSAARADTVTHRPARLESSPGTVELAITLVPPAS